MPGKKLMLIKESAELQQQLTRLSRVIYLYETIKDYDGFKNIKLLCEHDYRVIAPLGEEISFNFLKNHYLKQLPDLVHNLKDLQIKVTEFIERVKHRAPHCLKTGQFGLMVRAIISPKEVQKIINDASDFINYCSVHPFQMQSSDGANCTVSHSHIDERIQHTLDGLRVKNCNE